MHLLTARMRMTRNKRLNKRKKRILLFVVLLLIFGYIFGSEILNPSMDKYRHISTLIVSGSGLVVWSAYVIWAYLLKKDIWAANGDEQHE